ncbi:hypothetical protein Dimus_017944 [Dionaea muscipula]
MSTVPVPSKPSPSRNHLCTTLVVSLQIPLLLPSKSHLPPLVEPIAPMLLPWLNENKNFVLLQVGLGVDEVGGIGVNQELAVGVRGAEVAGQHPDDEDGMVQIPRHDEEVDK